MQSAQPQQHMLQRALGRHARILEAFLEFQAGPDPLTDAEVEALIRKRPTEYASLRTWLDEKKGRRS